LDHEEIENLSKSIATVFLQRQAQNQMASLFSFTYHLILILLKLFQKVEEEGFFQTHPTRQTLS
jgi:hypothetical protein